MNCKSQLKRIAIQKGEAMPVEDNVREKFEAATALTLRVTRREAYLLDSKGNYANKTIQLAFLTYSLGYQAAVAESAARIAELEQKLVEISSLMTLWKKGLLTGDELGKSLFVVHESKPAITNTGDNHDHTTRT